MLAIVSCAPVAAPPRVPGAADIPRLQGLLLRDSSDLPTRVALAVALRDAGKPQQARAILEIVVRERPGDAGPVLLLGLAQEEAGDWSACRISYQRYLTLSHAMELRRSVEHRLPYVQRRELEAEVKASLGRETELGASVPDPGTIAILPFVMQSPDTALRPLSRALAELLVTDLSVTDRLRVLERARVQLLLDEIARGRTGAMDPATVARGGRLLRAGRLVQGSVQGASSRLRLGALIQGTGRDSVARVSPATKENGIARLFEMEKSLALSLYGSLGIQLTDAERQRVQQRPTENLQALLAFGGALEAEDRGDWAEATRLYARALTLDPGFRLASAKAEAATGIADARLTTVQVLIETGIIEAVAAAPAPRAPGRASGLTPLTLGLGQTATSVLTPDPIRGILPDPLQRDPASEVLGSEGIGSQTVLRIIFHPPASTR